MGQTRHFLFTASLVIALAITQAGLAAAGPVPRPDPSGAPFLGQFNSADSTVLFSDDFESGDFSAWTSVQAGASATALVQSNLVKSGQYAAQFSATSTTGSFAYARKDFASPQTQLEVGGDFIVQQEGVSDSNVPLLRFFNSNGDRVISLYRQNLSHDQVWVQHSGDYHRTSGTLPLNTWGNVEAQVAMAGDGTATLQIWLNGTRIYETSSARLGTSGIKTLQIGDEVKRQAFTLVADNIIAQTGTEQRDDENTVTPETTIDSGPSGTVNSSSASFTFSSSEPNSTFECQLDGNRFTACSSPEDYSGLAEGTHEFQVRAVDTAGNVDPTPASRSWTVSFADSGNCDANAPLPANNDPGMTVLADGFESNSFDRWSRVIEQGDASVDIQDHHVSSNDCAVQINVGSDEWNSRGNLSKSLPSNTSEIWLSGSFKNIIEGDSGWNLPTYRIFSNGKRVLDVSRQNGSGDFFVRTPNGSGGWTIHSTGRKLNLNQWYDVKIHAIANWNHSTVEVWLDGARVYQTTSATLGVSHLDVVMLGAEHQNQGQFAADDIIMKAGH